MCITPVGNSLFLGFWTSSSIRGFHQGDYMAVYAGLAFGHALFVSLTSFAFTFVHCLILRTSAQVTDFVSYTALQA
jgi:hypothetical protein